MTAGEKVVKFIAGKQRDKSEPVYNFEVWRKHNYYVSSKESAEFILVHNACHFPKDNKDLAELLGIGVKDVHYWVQDIVSAYKSKFPLWMGKNPDVGPGPNGKLAFKCTQMGPNKGKIWESLDDFVDLLD